MSSSFPRSSAAGSYTASRRSFLTRSTGFISASSFFPAGLEQFGQLRARAVEPRAHGADRQLERLGHALVREVLPRDEQKRLEFDGWPRLDRGGVARETR